MSSFRRKRKSEENHSRDRWLISYADLVTLLLALFIVLYAASDKERAQRIAESFSAAGVNGNGILDGSAAPQTDEERKKNPLIQNPILLQKTKMQQTKFGLVVSLSEAGFFGAGDATVSSEADAVIGVIADSLAANASSVRIEGHTDSTPISTAKYPSNWELSTARASSVLARLIERGIAPDRLSAAGYAGFQPVQDNATPEGRAQNRRVDIVILDR